MTPKDAAPASQHQLHAEVYREQKNEQQEEQQQPEAAMPVKDLFAVLLEAASSTAGVAAGLTPELAASFSSLMDRLAPAEQAAKDFRLRLLLESGLHSAAAQLMNTALTYGLGGR
ncbi:hypothetical protein ABPG77_004204 [Micractinium sp. CCAP 211/92]